MASIHPQIADVVDELATCSDRLHALAGSVGEAELLARPNASTWSIAECIAHLALTSRAYLPIIDTALAAGERAVAGETPRFRMDMKGRLLCWIVEPPYRVKVKTPPAFVPDVPASRADALESFDASQADLVSRIRAGDGAALDRIMVVSPFNAHMRYNLYSCFKVLPAHERRHIWQGEQIRSMLRTASASS